MKLVIVFLGGLGFAGVALAAPELLVTKPPVVSGSEPFTGPIVDPTASYGQWFTGVTTGIPSSGGGLPTGGQFALPVQFYDNPEQPVNPVNGGGGWDGTNAITGVVSSVTMVGGDITAFQIQAAITYDMPPQSPWPAGSNSHGETLNNTNSLNVVAPPTLTANFAISSVNNLPAAFTGPYVLQSPQIVATNENLLAWYCWTPGYAPNGQANGGYYVPAWNNFTYSGNWQWQDTLDFTVQGAGLAPTDPRASNIESSYVNGKDIFTSQSSALKISNWQSSLNLDPGTLYPTGQDLSDVSVFVPHPIILKVLSVPSTSAPTNYGTNEGILTVGGVHNAYTTGYLPVAPAAISYVQVNGFYPETDEEIFALDVQVNGVEATPAQIAILIDAIDGTDGYAPASPGVAAVSNTWAGLGLGGADPFIDTLSVSPFNLFLDMGDVVDMGTGPYTYFGWDVSSEDPNLVGYTIEEVAVVPEPMSLGLLVLGGLGLMSRRPRKA